MKLRELKDLTLRELREKETQLKEEQFNFRFQAVAGQLEKSSLIRRARKTLARVKTLIRLKELAGEK